MRFCIFFALFLHIVMMSGPVAARQSSPAVPTPWQEDETDLQDMDIKPLSIEDLEQFDPAGQQKEAPRRSALEKAYSNRIADELEQYGYALFAETGNQDNRPAPPAGTVKDDYVLNTGDKLDIILRGQISGRATVEIDSQGFLVIKDFPPISAATHTLGEIRKELQAEAAQMHNTQIFVSLSGIRQIGVLVVGHVTKPGRKTLTAFHTVLDALSAAGGIQKTGSLRRLKLIRDGKSYFIDLYYLLMRNGGRADMLLKDGDRIVVPPIGPTVAVGGFLKRPGIYELRDGEILSLREMLGLGGGIITPGKNRYIKLDFSKDGEETVQDIEDKNLKLFKDGSILMVAQAKAERTQSVTLSGDTRQPGTHALKQAGALSELIDSPKVLGQDTYPLIGIIERKDPRQLTKRLLPFSPRQVLQGVFDRKLQSGDIVHLFSNTQIRNLDRTPDDNPERPLLHKTSLQLQKPEDGVRHIRDPLLVSILQERSVFVRGAVRVPGAYPVAEGATLDNVLSVAGGPTLEADQTNIEITSRLQGEGLQSEGRSGKQRIAVNLTTQTPAEVQIGPGDTVRVNQTFHRIADKSVVILGEVLHPGRYDLMPGDTMSSLLQRAGGVTAQAYPPGSIFSRAAERKAEENRYKAQARDLEMKLASSLQQVDDDEKPDMAEVTAVQSLISELKTAKAVGRITVETDPGVLTTDPEQDILLEAGDRIYIPKRPLTVRVAGEVQAPAALQFRKDKSARDYINGAGGTTYYADESRSFVIYPDGSAQPLHAGRWEHNAVFIPPGSTIIVPRDPKPFNFLEGAERISQILANLAISGLYIEAIGDD